MKCTMQIIDVDYFTKDGKPIVRIFGKREDGQAVCGFYEGFRPYFYVEKNDTVKQKLDEMRLTYEEVQRRLPEGYQASTVAVYKVIVDDPASVPRIRGTLERAGKCYEADVLFKYRFMVDHGLRGMCWAEADCEPVRTAAAKTPSFRIKSIVPVQRTSNAPTKILCLDIECLQADANRAPDPKYDPIIAVGLAFLPTYRGAQSAVLVAKPSSGENVYGFRGEKDMLEGLLRIIDEFDPDVITGYNINNFDIPYLVERLKKFGLSQALGRCDKQVRLRSFGGKHGGDFGSNQEVDITGRVVADVYQLLRRDTAIRLNRYDLGTAAMALIGEGKADVKHGEIPALWAKDTGRLIAYARKDAMITLQMLIERRMLDKFVEIAKIAGPLLQDCLKGQTVRIETMVLHEFGRRGIIMPSKPSEAAAAKNKEEQIKGGAVLEPTRGLHKDSVLVLDFQALYPSIIKAFNVSIDTLILDDAGVPCHTAPNGARFVDKSVYEGVFPALISSLLAARLEAKRAMKSASLDERRALDAKQYALKILANSFYGYCGYVRARLFRGEIANAITAYGRDNIVKTKTFVESTFPVKVIYGDTDSLFVKADISDLEKAQRLGEEISAAVASQVGLHLEFEKIYRTFLILTKKRYAGWKVERKADGWAETLDMRGIETVRRDWCPLVGELMLSVLNVILKERDVGKATRLVKSALSQLAAGQVPLEKLTIVKGVTRSLDSYDGIQPHVVLARKMQKRDPANAPKVGDRIGYVIVRGKDLLSMRAEDPDYVRQNGLQLDVGYYINSQLLPPIERIFEALGIEKGELIGAGKQVSIFELLGDKKGLACEDCGRAWRRVPLSGRCECGGKIK